MNETTKTGVSIPYRLPAERAVMLAAIADTIAAGDARELLRVIARTPIDLERHGAHVQAIPDDPPHGLPDTVDAMRPELVQALQASALPGVILDDELAGVVVDAMRTLGSWLDEPPNESAERLAVHDAMLHASQMRDRYGDDDPRTHAAMVKAIEMQEPGACGRMLAECGIELPEPTRCDENGRPIYSLEEVASALGVDPEELAETTHELADMGLGVLRFGTGHTLQ